MRGTLRNWEEFLRKERAAEFLLEFLKGKREVILVWLLRIGGKVPS